MSALIYVSGPPAAGKSTLMAELTAGYVRVPVGRPFAHDVLADPATGIPAAVEIGGRPPGRRDYPGTDVLSMGVAPLARAWIAAAGAPLILAEGDRLAHRGFLDAAAAAGYDVTLIDLYATHAQLAARRRARRSTQSEAWCRGRATKAANLAACAADAGWHLVQIDAGGTPAELAGMARRAVPALDAALPVGGRR